MSGRRSAATVYAIELIKQGVLPYSAAKMAGISPSTIYRVLARMPDHSREALKRDLAPKKKTRRAR